MINKRILSVDGDGVLFDFIQGLTPFLKEKGIDHSHLSKYKGKSIHIPAHELFNLDPSLSFKLLVEFNNSKHVKNLPIFEEDSIQNIQEIKREGYDIYLTTCLGRTENCLNYRFENVRKLFGNIIGRDNIIMLDIDESKEKSLRYLSKKGNLFGHIDDRLKHIFEAKQANTRAIWYNNQEQLHRDNEKHENIIHVKNWSEIKNLLLY